jgi:hypothetical protein
MIRVISLFSLFIFSFEGFAQKQTTDEQQIEDLIQNAFDGVWSDFDEKAVDKYHTPDFLLLEHGEVWTNGIIKSYQVKGRANSNGIKRTNSFEFLKIEVTDSRAWCAYKNFATISKDGAVVKKLEWLESANAIKTPTGWKLVLMHSTRVDKKE